ERRRREWRLPRRGHRIRRRLPHPLQARSGDVDSEEGRRQRNVRGRSGGSSVNVARMNFHRKAVFGGLLSAIIASAGNLRASGFAAARFGGELGGVTSTNPTALYYNPAGIGFSTGASLFADGDIAIRHFSWE